MIFLPGVTIGNEVVIGARSVVNRDIPSGVIAAGNLCKVIRKITENDKKKILERMKGAVALSKSHKKTKDGTRQ